MKPLIHILILLSFFIVSANAKEKETITWANVHFPPWMILTGESKGMGVWDELLHALITALPEYNHRTVIMKNVRYDLLAEQEEKVCKVYYYKNPRREKFLYYSIPSVVFLSGHIVMLTEKAKILGDPASISLDRLMKDSRFKGTIIKARSYGKVLDRIIAANRHHNNLKEEVMLSKNLFEFISLKRTDYILIYPAEWSFFEKELNLHPDVSIIAIDEAIPYNITHVTCAKSEWGKGFIERVDKILKTHIPTQAHKNATLRWYAPREKQRLEKMYQEYLVDPIQAQSRR
jgi:uncharacterized protein (TIGR02285 family)